MYIRCSPRSMWHVTLEFSPKVDSSRIFEFTRFSPIFTFDLSPSKGRCKSIDENLQFRLEISLISDYPEMFQFLLQPPSENIYIFRIEKQKKKSPSSRRNSSPRFFRINLNFTRTRRAKNIHFRQIPRRQTV